MLNEIEKVIDEQIRPRLQNDGGNVAIVDFNKEDKTLRLRLMGQCCTCPHSSHTIENIINLTLKSQIDGLGEIIVETGLSNEMIDLAKKFLRGENSELESSV